MNEIFEIHSDFFYKLLSGCDPDAANLAKQTWIPIIGNFGRK